MMIGLVDTNIITAIFKDDKKCTSKLDAYVERYGTMHLSLIVYYEVYRGLLDLGSQKKLNSFADFVDNSILFGIEKEVMDEASKIYLSLKRQGD
jgi:predicted nucleic acid-binding protein